MPRHWRWAGIALLVTAIGFVNYISDRGRAENGQHAHEPQRVPAVEHLGPEDAPIEIVARYYRPSGTARDALKRLKRVVDQYDPHVRVTFINTRPLEGRDDERRESSPDEGSLTINGRSEFSRIVSGELRTVEFRDAPFPYGGMWRETDLHEFLKAELEHLGLDAEKSEEATKRAATGQTYSMGNPGRLVRVTAYYPMPEECVEETCKVLREVAEEYKDRVYFQFVDTCSDDGFTEWIEAGTDCHGILINGKQEYEVDVDGEAETVTFEAPEGGEWTREQFEAVLEALLALLKPREP